MNFAFMGGSMGRAVGGAIVKGAQTALEKKMPFCDIYIFWRCKNAGRNN